MNDKIDRWYPYALGLLAAALYLVCFREKPIPSLAKDLFTSALNVFAIAAGFLATSKAVLFSISKSRPVRWLKSGNHYNTLIDYLLNALCLCFIAAIVSFLSIIIIDPSKPQAHDRYAFAVWIFFCVSSIASSWRVISLLGLLLRKID